MAKDTILVIVGNELPQRDHVWWKKFDVIIAPSALRMVIEEKGCVWVDLADFVDPGSVYDATLFAQELSRLVLPNGTPISKSCMYRGYELWWIHYSDLFLHFCLPFTQYKKLLAYLQDFKNVCVYDSPYNDLFAAYCKAHSQTFSIIYSRRNTLVLRAPLGLFLQTTLTLLSLPVIFLRRRKVLVCTGDKFDGTNDYDARMKFIYEALRTERIPFVESIRSLESWKIILKHALGRKRPVIYSAGLAFLGRCMSFLSGARFRSEHAYTITQWRSLDSDAQFRLSVATHYLRFAGDDIWTIRINAVVLRLAGIKAASVTAANDRNFPTVLGCKIARIPTVGILHGAASRFYTMYDFMHEYTGEKMLSADRYGVWSEWWKEYYLTYSKAYSRGQLYVSGPMRPVVVKSTEPRVLRKEGEPIRVLFVSEIVAIPMEVIPYLDALVSSSEFSVFIKFRAVGDGFEEWLVKNRPDILSSLGEERILRGSMHEAIGSTDIVVGSQSTGVIEASLENKPFVLFNTLKWGDYFDMRSFESSYTFFAEDPRQLLECIKNAKHIPSDEVEKLKERFFGDPHQNGSKWVVDQLRLLAGV